VGATISNRLEGLALELAERTRMCVRESIFDNPDWYREPSGVANPAARSSSADEL
jgi:hypothetical protein